MSHFVFLLHSLLHRGEHGVPPNGDLPHQAPMPVAQNALTLQPVAHSDGHEASAELGSLKEKNAQLARSHGGCTRCTPAGLCSASVCFGYAVMLNVHRTHLRKVYYTFFKIRFVLPGLCFWHGMMYLLWSKGYHTNFHIILPRSAHPLPITLLCLQGFCLECKLWQGCSEPQNNEHTT